MEVIELKKYALNKGLCWINFLIFVDNIGTFPYLNDCKKYIVCQTGYEKVETCTFGLVYNPNIKGCDWAANVPTCV